jgi:hypothetical protein
MSEYVELPNLPGYVPIKDASKMLGIAEKTVYYYIEQRRLPAVWAGDVLMISLDEIEKFKLNPAGRPRKNTPPWRISSKGNIQLVTSINVQIQAGKRDGLTKRLDEIRRGGLHDFAGTVARYIIGYENSPDEVEILLIWKTSVAPDKVEREEALEAFRHELADVLDWNTAEYNDGTALMHT